MLQGILILFGSTPACGLSWSTTLVDTSIPKSSGLWSLRIGRSERPLSNERHRTSSRARSNRLEKTVAFAAAMKIEKNPIPKRPMGECLAAWIPGNSVDARSLAQKLLPKSSRSLDRVWGDIPTPSSSTCRT